MLNNKVIAPNPLPGKRIPLVGGSQLKIIPFKPVAKGALAPRGLNTKVKRVEGLPPMKLSPVYTRWLTGMSRKLY